VAVPLTLLNGRGARPEFLSTSFLLENYLQGPRGEIQTPLVGECSQHTPHILGIKNIFEKIYAIVIADLFIERCRLEVASCEVHELRFNRQPTRTYERFLLDFRTGSIVFGRALGTSMTGQPS